MKSVAQVKEMYRFRMAAFSREKDESFCLPILFRTVRTVGGLRRE